MVFQQACSQNATAAPQTSDAHLGTSTVKAERVFCYKGGPKTRTAWRSVLWDRLVRNCQGGPQIGTGIWPRNRDRKTAQVLCHRQQKRRRARFKSRTGTTKTKLSASSMSCIHTGQVVLRNTDMKHMKELERAASARWSASLACAGPHSCDPRRPPKHLCRFALQGDFRREWKFEEEASLLAQASKQTSPLAKSRCIQPALPNATSSSAAASSRTQTQHRPHPKPTLQP